MPFRWHCQVVSPEPPPPAGPLSLGTGQGPPVAEEQPGTHLGHRPPSSQDLQGRELQRLFVLESHGVARSPPERGTGSSCGWSPAQRAVQELPGPRLRHCRALLLLPLSPLPCGGVHGQPSPPWPQPLLGASSGPSNHSDVCRGSRLRPSSPMASTVGTILVPLEGGQGLVRTGSWLRSQPSAQDSDPPLKTKPLTQPSCQF